MNINLNDNALIAAVVLIIATAVTLVSIFG